MVNLYTVSRGKNVQQKVAHSNANIRRQGVSCTYNATLTDREGCRAFSAEGIILDANTPNGTPHRVGDTKSMTQMF